VSKAEQDPARQRPLETVVNRSGRPAASAFVDASPEEKGTDRAVRVSATSLDRMMALAGERTIESRWLDPFCSALLTLKRRQLELTDRIQEAHAIAQYGGSTEILVGHLLDAQNRARDCHAEITERMNEIVAFTHMSSNLSDRLYREVLSSRMRPFGDGARRLPRIVRDVARELGKKIKLEIQGTKTEVDREILERLEVPLTHLVQNAIDHGIEAPAERLAAGKPENGTLRIEARHQGGHLVIVIADDGRGIDCDELRKTIVARGLAKERVASALSEVELLSFLFLPGFSTAKAVTKISGRGFGLDVVQSTVREVGGQVTIESRKAEGTTFRFELPITRAVMRTLVVDIGGEAYAFPLTEVDRVLRMHTSQMRTLDGKRYFHLEGTSVELTSAAVVLELAAQQAGEELPVIILSHQDKRYGLIVDDYIGERDLVVQRLDPRLSTVPNISAASVLQDGSPVLILSAEEMIRSIGGMAHAALAQNATAQIEAAKWIRALVVDDSQTVRETLRRQLEGRGHVVDVAVDGIAGWNAVRHRKYDIVISDVDMPRMNGLELTSRMKADQRLASIPVILISYMNREQDRIEGLKAGAVRYFGKNTIGGDVVAETVEELLGGAR
jgi:two-component system sensor histidine kinase and response regulator WspE